MESTKFGLIVLNIRSMEIYTTVPMPHDRPEFKDFLNDKTIPHGDYDYWRVIQGEQGKANLSYTLDKCYVIFVYDQ